ncbi:MAG: SIS domain-containing protein [Alphaproteobacteria bacterium]|nr:SIS domain-containing protein [Alphaproteobacteria bacterium]
MSSDATLKSLYPFLHGDKQDAAAMTDALVESVRQKAAHHVSVFDDFFARNAETLAAAAETVAETYRQGGRLLTMGNGGSSCDAAHVAVEFQHPVTAGRPALPAINLTSEVAMLTAVGNDVGMDHIYVRQVLAQGREGDCLIGLSTSGNSDNLVRAFRKAREMGIATIGFSGMSGGKMATMGLNHCLTVETDSVHRIQEVHLAAYHMIWDLVHTLLADSRGASGSMDPIKKSNGLGGPA